jgi:hypothetical protein
VSPCRHRFPEPTAARRRGARVLSAARQACGHIATRVASSASCDSSRRPRWDVATTRRRLARLATFHGSSASCFSTRAAPPPTLARCYGRSRSGTRPIGVVPLGHWRTITFVAGLRQTTIVAPLVLLGPPTWAPALAPTSRSAWRRRSSRSTSWCSIREGAEDRWRPQALAVAGALILHLPPSSLGLKPDRAAVRHPQGAATQSRGPDRERALADNRPPV